jgi:Ca2+-binding EF-hand superfamily protein
MRNIPTIESSTEETFMTFARSVLAAAAMTLACGVAFADEKGFNDMDKNTDGRLSRSEAAGNKDVTGKWKQMDANNDGVVTRAEYLKVMAKKDGNSAKQKVAGKDDKPRQAKSFNDMDKNNDGKLSRAEAAGNKELLAKWKELDGDNDGSLSRTEYLKNAARQDTAKVRERVGKTVDNVRNRDDASTGSTTQRK